MEMLSGDQTEKILQFQELTGINDVSICRDVLQRHSWDLEVAIQEQLNIREGRPSMFSVTSRTPNVVTDSLAQQLFLPHPRGGDGGGIFGIFRYVVNLLFNVYYHTFAKIFQFTFSLIRPDPRRQVTDPLRDVMKFVNSFEEKYGPRHPVFYQGTYSQAVTDAKQELRFLLVFLHNEKYPESDIFCREALSDDNVINMVNNQTLLWGCDVNSGEGYRVSQIMRERSYPFMAVIVMKEGQMTLVARMEGRMNGPELSHRLQAVMADNEPYLAAARADRLERSFNQSLRAQQDEAFELSLRADQEKERERREERRRAQELLDEVRRQQQEEEDRKQAIERLKMELVDTIPPEPDNSHLDTVHLVFKLPSGQRLERRFLKTHSLQDVHNFVLCHPSAPDSFEMTTNFPKRVLQVDVRTTLEAAGLKRGEVLFIADLDA